MSASAESTAIPGIPGSAWVLCVTCEKQRLRAQCHRGRFDWTCLDCIAKAKAKAKAKKEGEEDEEEEEEEEEEAEQPVEVEVKKPPTQPVRRSGWEVLRTVARAPVEVQEKPTVRPELPVGDHADTTAHMDGYARIQADYRQNIERGRVDPKAPGEVGRLVRGGLTQARAKRLVAWAIREEIGVKS